MMLDLTTDLGFPFAIHQPSPRDELQAAGLHRNDPRMPFAEEALRASKPTSRPRLLSMFGTAPPSVEIPQPAHKVALFETHRGLAAAVAGAAAMAAAGPPALLWPVLTQALLLWRQQRCCMVGDPLIPLTANLQGLAESHIGRLDRAAFYAVCIYPEWRDAAATWFSSLAHPWLADWIESNPTFNMLVEDARDIFGGKAPAWLPGAYR